MSFKGLKRRLTIKKRKSPSSLAPASDAEDRVVMLCEDIPSESSCDSGRGSQSPGGRSSGESFHGDEESKRRAQRSKSLAQRGESRQQQQQRVVVRHHSLREPHSSDSSSPPSPGDHYAMRSALHVKELCGSVSHCQAMNRCSCSHKQAYTSGHINRRMHTQTHMHACKHHVYICYKKAIVMINVIFKCQTTWGKKSVERKQVGKNLGLIKCLCVHLVHVRTLSPLSFISAQNSMSSLYPRRDRCA